MGKKLMYQMLRFVKRPKDMVKKKFLQKTLTVN